MKWEDLEIKLDTINEKLDYLQEQIEDIKMTQINNHLHLNYNLLALIKEYKDQLY